MFVNMHACNIATVASQQITQLQQLYTTSQMQMQLTIQLYSYQLIHAAIASQLNNQLASYVRSKRKCHTLYSLSQQLIIIVIVASYTYSCIHTYIRVYIATIYSLIARQLVTIILWSPMDSCNFDHLASHSYIYSQPATSYIAITTCMHGQLYH